MTTTAVSVILLTIYWVLNRHASPRLFKAKAAANSNGNSKGKAPQTGQAGQSARGRLKAILPRLNLVILAAAGFGLSQAWVADLIGWLNLEIFGLGIKLFTVLMIAGVALFVIDMLDGGGIKPSSNVIAFAMPIVAASSGGAIAALITGFSGGINEYAGQLMASWV
ncbi:hypothetical protein Aph01nite_08380 [Acrocarpospora phusangensis]|uniref:Uncharacterized protein n=1 Tax=Acrocarpospora phusangensis TaxID=1070424 RepID=A0A919Q7W1_9ACTN|nr:hypothetical protein [Acrocarpospora phusangensis]GIH22528.1 hypothetical protein Aph01nite_08380 [Acrocarpospora phusangensis]